jgi:type IV secretion system protein VirB2
VNQPVRANRDHARSHRFFAVFCLVMPALVAAQGFDKINTTVTNVNAILVTISIAVVTIAIIWAGFKMIFQGARLADVANVLIGGTLVGGAAAFASYIVT